MERIKNRFCFATDVIDCMEEKILNIKNELADDGMRNHLQITSFDAYKSGRFWFCVLEQKQHIAIQGLMEQCNAHTTYLARLLNQRDMVALSSIFKKDPTVFNRNTTTLIECKRIVMTLEIINNPMALAAYASIHAPQNIWPQILENMNTMGIIDMEIYLYGYQAFLVMDTKPDFDLEIDGAAWAKLPREQEWQTYVSQFQKINADTKAVDKWKVLTSITK